METETLQLHYLPKMPSNTESFIYQKKKKKSQNETQNNSDHSEDRKRYWKSKESGMQLEEKKKKKCRLQFDLKTKQWISLQNTRMP